MSKKLTIGALLFGSALLVGCATKQPSLPPPELVVTTIPQPTFNILKVYAESPVVRIPPQDQTVICNGCDLLPEGLSQDDDVIWVRLSPHEQPMAQDETVVDSRHFDFDKAILKGDLSKLKLIADRLKENPNVDAHIVGHTDSSGSKQYNLGLGLKRAEAVKRWLVSQGIDSKRILTDTKGESSPIATNKTKAGRAKNRRAVVTINVTG